MEKIKFAVISDVHSNIQALNAVLEDINRHGIKKIYCLGDLVGYGGNPRQVVDHAMDFDFVLRGNHDDAVTFKLPKDFNPTAARAVYWTREQLKADYTSSRKGLKRWAFMRRKLHLKVRIGEMCFVHGTFESYFKYVDSVSSAMAVFKKLPPDIKTMFCGHTHVAGVFVEDTDGFIRWIGPYAKKFPPLGTLRMIINCGSVGQPRDCDCRASYMLVSGNRFFYRRVPYDVAEAMRSIKSKGGLPNFSAERLLDGT
jgi:diadenosine tetraphosphatase ApaH/serine/threonine PP2A family protein phosphatase